VLGKSPAQTGAQSAAAAGDKGDLAFKRHTVSLSQWAPARAGGL